MRVLNFSDGFSSASAPTGSTVSATALAQFANDAAYVTAKGSAAAEGDCYANTTDHSIHYYDGTEWTSPGAFVVFGSYSAPVLVSSGVSLPIHNVRKQVIFIKGALGEVDLSNINPQIAVGNVIGDELWLIGCSDANFVTITDGNGVSQNGLQQIKDRWGMQYIWGGATLGWWQGAKREN